MTGEAGGGAPPRGRTPSVLLLALSTMLGGGIFVVVVPAAAAAGDRLLLALLIAAGVAAANAGVAAGLARPSLGPAPSYTAATQRLGVAWGHLAGWALVVATCAGCAALAQTVGLYLWPGHDRLLAITVVLAVLALTVQGMSPPRRLVLGVVVTVAALLLLLMLALLLAPPEVAPEARRAVPDRGWPGLLQASAFLTFVLVGHTRAMGDADADGVRPRTIRRGVLAALVAVTALYAGLLLLLLDRVGPGWVALRAAPLAEVAEISGWSWLGVVLRAVAGLCATTALLTLLPRAGRLIAVLAEDRHLPASLARADGPGRSRRLAEAVAAVLVVVLVLLLDVRSTLAISVAASLVAAAVLNASALRAGRGASRVLAVVALLGCVASVVALPWTDLVLCGLLLLGGAVVGWGRQVASRTSDSAAAEATRPAPPTDPVDGPSDLAPLPLDPAIPGTGGVPAPDFRPEATGEGHDLETDDVGEGFTQPVAPGDERSSRGPQSGLH